MISNCCPCFRSNPVSGTSIIPEVLGQKEIKQNRVYTIYNPNSPGSKFVMPPSFFLDPPPPFPELLLKSAEGNPWAAICGEADEMPLPNQVDSLEEPSVTSWNDRSIAVVGRNYSYPSLSILSNG